MSANEFVSPILSFLGASVGAWLVYSRGRKDQWGRRFESALVLMADSDPRKRAMGRARLTEVTKDGSTGRTGRAEALAVLREDVRIECPDDMWRQLSSVDMPAAQVLLDESRSPGVQGDEMVVSAAMVQSAKAYIGLAGGADAVKLQALVLIAEASAPEPEWAGVAEPGVGSPPAPALGLPTDQKLILVKLSPDAGELSEPELRERARQHWRLSLSRVRSESPFAVVAVVRQEVIGAWRFRGVEESAEWEDRVVFELGESVPDLVGRQYKDTGQNPVRYWP